MVSLEITDCLPTPENDMRTQVVKEFPGHFREGDVDTVATRFKALASHFNGRFPGANFSFTGGLPLQDGMRAK